METILLVDDDSTVRAVLRELLKEAGYTVLDTGDPWEALEIAQTYPEPIHLLLTDVVMPPMNGCELAERLRPIRPQTKVLFMSGFVRSWLPVETVIPAGARLLAKPFTREELSRRVREVLDYRSPFARERSESKT